MRQSLMVELDAGGLPAVQVPFSCMWDLVEYLSYQRVVVNYAYHASHFTVSFPRSDVESAQRIMNNWARIQVREMQNA